MIDKNKVQFEFLESVFDSFERSENGDGRGTNKRKHGSLKDSNTEDYE